MKEKKDKHFVKKPIYKGGPKALKKFITEQLKYPESALEHKISGTVHINYTVNYLGEVTEAKVISGLGHGCDEEAIRVVKRLKFTVPKHYGIKVKFHKNIQIHFRLPKEKIEPPPNTPSIQYTLLDQDPKTDAATQPTPKSKSYQYTIKWKSGGEITTVVQP